MIIPRPEVFVHLRELDAGRRAAPRVAVVSGPAASGKTEVVTSYCDGARERFGVAVLHATCAAEERTLPLALVTQLFDGDGVPPAARDRVHAAVAGIGGHAPVEDAEAPLDPLVAGVAQETMAALRELAETSPVILCVDDVQHGDFASLQVLLYLLRRLSSGRFILLVTDSPHVTPAHSHLRAELVRWSSFHSVAVDVFETAQVRELIVGSLPDLADDVVDEITAAAFEVSGGSPLLVQGLIKDIGDTADRDETGKITVDPAGLGAGEAYRTAALSLLLRLGAQVRPVAVAVAVLGADADETSVARLLDAGADAVAPSLAALEACGVLGEHGYRHAGLATTFLATVDPGELDRLHTRAAEVLHELGADPRQVADHLIAGAGASAGTVLEHTGWAVGVLVDAAADALTIDDTAAAIAFLDLAEAHCPDRTQRARITFNLARIEWRNEPAAAALRFDELTDAMRESLLTTHQCLRVVRWLLWLGRPDAAEAVELLLARSDVGEPEIVAELVTLHRWHPTRVPLRSVSVPAGNPNAAPPALQAVAAFQSTVAEGPNEHSTTLAERVLSDCDLGDTAPEAILAALQTLIHADRHAQAAAWCRRLIRTATDRHAPTWEAVLAAVRADAALRNGDVTAAQKWSAYALNRISRRSWGVLVGYPIAVRLQALTAMGDYDEAASLARQGVPEEIFSTSVGLRYLRARAAFYLASNRLNSARLDVERWAGLAKKWGFDLPAREPWRVAQAQIELALGRPEVAQRIASEQLDRPGGMTRRVRGQALRVLAAADDLRRRPAMLREAIDLLQACGDRTELALAMAELSQAHSALGDFNRAQLMSRRALEVAQECGSSVVCCALLGVDPAGATDRSDAAGVSGIGDTAGAGAVGEAGRQAIAKLSSAERRVAELAVVGHTNREISAKLFITVSTVEQHLTRIYRKLGVTRRADLPLHLPTGSQFAPTLARAVNA